MKKSNPGKNKQTISILEESPKFKSFCEEIRKKWEKHKAAIFTGTGDLEWYDSISLGRNIPIALIKDLSEIRKVFGLGPEWERTLIQYIFYGEQLQPPLHRFDIHGDWVRGEIVLRIGLQTTKEDIKNNFSIIEDFKQLLFNKRRALIRMAKNFERAKKTSKLKKKGKTHKTILKIIKEDNLSSEELGTARRRYEKKITEGSPTPIFPPHPSIITGHENS
ncbi:hypothetical protein ACFL52_00955 [Candidatus Margulisiibacteriota bacterium]